MYEVIRAKFEAYENHLWAVALVLLLRVLVGRWALCWDAGGLCRLHGQIRDGLPGELFGLDVGQVRFGMRLRSWRGGRLLLPRSWPRRMRFSKKKQTFERYKALAGASLVCGVAASLAGQGLLNVVMATIVGNWAWVGVGGLLAGVVATSASEGPSLIVLTKGVGGWHGVLEIYARSVPACFEVQAAGRCMNASRGALGWVGDIACRGCSVLYKAAVSVVVRACVCVFSGSEHVPAPRMAQLKQDGGGVTTPDGSGTVAEAAAATPSSRVGGSPGEARTRGHPDGRRLADGLRARARRLRKRIRDSSSWASLNVAKEELESIEAAFAAMQTTARPGPQGPCTALRHMLTEAFAVAFARGPSPTVEELCGSPHLQGKADERDPQATGPSSCARRLLTSSSAVGAWGWASPGERAINSLRVEGCGDITGQTGSVKSSECHLLTIESLRN
eukprot:14230540-Alexandrium_andersonii.AAC.1